MVRGGGAMGKKMEKNMEKEGQGEGGEVSLLGRRNGSDGMIYEEG